ncbi:ankyrin, partial [Mytilinidion resinicola]
MCLKILVISRNELDISEAFKCRAIPTIQMGTENVSKDIEIFIRGETNRLIQKNKLRIYSSELKEKVVERLTSEADGMFLWPRLQLDTICRERSEQDVEKCLKNLPRHLDETYSRMIRQINEQSDSLRTLAYKTIMWVLHAARPLRITELRHATAIGDSGRTWKDLRPYDADVIIDACANFLVEENLTIRLVHYSANEYLKASFHHSQLTDALDPSYAHTQLSFACIRYLLLDFPKEGPCQSPKELYRTIQRYTFCFYASNFFDFHLKEMLNIHDDIVKLINKFFSLGNGAIAAVLQIRRLSNAFDHAQVEWDFDRTRYSVTPATILFATRLCEVPWVAKRARWPKPGPPKAPTRATIHEAARAGEVEATKHLFKQGKSANDLDENGAEPLYYACLNGQQPVATFLVFKGANVNHQSGSFDKGSPLHIAALGGYLQIVEMLLHNGAEPN